MIISLHSCDVHIHMIVFILLYRLPYIDFTNQMHTFTCSIIYGGLVIPRRTMHPSGITPTSFHSNSGRVMPISYPYAPRSSLVSQISTTPSVVGIKQHDKKNDVLINQTTQHLVHNAHMYCTLWATLYRRRRLYGSKKRHSNTCSNFPCCTIQ